MSEPILPDADAAYLINHWERLSPVDQEAARKRLRIWKAAKDQRQQEKALDLEAAYLDGDAAFDARQPALKARFETSEDRQRFRQVAYISTLTGHDPRKVAMDLPGYQRAVAERAWKTPEAGVSPQAFETEAKRRMQKQRDFRHLLEGEPEKPKSLPASPVTVMPGKPAEEAKPAGLMPLLQKAWSDAIEGRDGTIGFIDWQAAAQSDPRYDHKRLSQFSDAYFRAYDATHRAMDEARARPAVARIMEGFKAEQERSGAYGGDSLIAEVQGVSKEARPALFAMLQAEAAKAGKDKPAGWQFLQALGRGGVGMLVGTSRTMAASELDATEQFLATLKPGDEIGGRFIAPGDKPGDALMRVEGPNGAVESALTRWIFEPLLTNKTITQADIDAAKAKVADQRDKLGINLQLEQIAKGQFDPIKGGNWLTQKVIYPFAESVAPQMALAALTRKFAPVGGVSTVGQRALSMTSGAGAMVPMFGMMADQNAQQLMAQNPGMEVGQAYRIGREASYVQTGLEYAQSLLALGALPKFSKALEHARAGAWANFGKGLLVQGLEQNAIEGVQDIMPSLVQALHSDAPGVDWNKAIGDWASSRADTFWAVLPAVIFGAGGEALRSKVSRPQLEALAAGITDPMQLKAAGFNASDIAVITAEKDIDAQLEKFTAAMPRRSEAVAKQGRAELDARTTAVETLQREGALPSFRRTAEGFEVLAGDKLVGKAATAQEALQLGALHSDAMAAMSGEAVAYMASQLQAIDLARNMGAQGESSSITEFRPDEVRTVAQEIAEDPNAEARVLAQMQAQDAIDGTEGTAEVVFGSSETTFQNGVRMTVNRLYAGSSVLVVFHEETHGFYRDALARGRLTRETTEQFLRAVDTVLAGRTDKQGRQLRLLPEGEATPEAIDEAVSELMEAEILRTRKTLPDGIVSKNLSAIAKLAPEAARQFGAFVRVVRQYWGRVFGRSLAIRKGLKSGAIDSTAYAEFFDKLLGTDGAAAHEQAAVEAASEILGDPFSLGGELSRSYSLAPSFSLESRRVSPSDYPESLRSVIVAGSKPLQNMDGFDAAKTGGDKRAAWKIAVQIFKKADLGKIREILNGRPALFAPVTAKESERGNMLPVAAAWALAKLTGGKVWERLYKISSGHNTNAKQSDRAKRDHAFAGELPPPGSVVVIVDDTFTSGNTITAMIDALPEMPVAAVTMARSRYGTHLAATEQEVTRALDKMGISADQFASEFGFPITRATGAELHGYFLNGASGVNGFRARFDAGGIRKGASMVRETGLEPGFSIGHRQQLNALVAHAASRIRDPKQKAAVYSRMVEKLNALRRDTSRIIRAFGKDLQTATLSEEKTLARIRQEKSAWRDARIAELIEQEMTPEQMQAIDLPADVLDARQYPVTDSVMRRIEYTAKRNGKTHRVVTLRGTLLSRSAARNAGGEYDIPNGVPSYVFGGTVEPDVAAQQAGFDSTDDFWEALAQEAQTAAGLREQMQKAKEAMKAIEAQAKADADEWEAAQIRQQRRDYSPRAKIIRALGMLDGIIASVPMEVRGKIGGFVQLAKLGTDEKRLEFLQERLAKVEEVVERHFQKEFTGDLNKLLERAKPQKNAAGEKPKGKLGPIGHALFEIADRAREMDAAGVAGLLAELQARLDSGELTGEQQAEVQAQMEIAQLVGDWKHADSARMAEAVAALDGAFGDHWLTWQKRIKQRAEAREEKKKEGIALTGKAGTPAERRERFEADNGIVGKVKDFFLGFGSFGDVVRFAFGDGDFSNEWIDRERKASQAKEDANQAFAEEVDGVFADLAGSSYQGQLLRWRLSRPTIDGGKAGIISELEAMQAVLMGRQEDGRRHLEAFGYDAEWLQSMEEALSPEGAAVLDWMADTYAAEYERLNAVYRERQGVNLPRHSNYAPLTVKPAQAQGGEMVDPVTGGTVAGVSSTPGFLRTRSRIAKAEPEFRDALATLIAHRQALEHWIAYGDLANDLGAIYRNRDFGNAVEAAGGKEAISELRKWVDVFTLGGLRDAATTLAANQALGRWTARAASMALIGRLSVVLVQATQLGAAVAQMPVGSYVFRLAKLLSGQLNWSAALQSDFVRRRLEQTPPFVRQALEGLRSGRPNRIKWAMHAMGRAISGADAIFTAGTYAIIYDYQLKQALKLGLRGEEASNRAANEAERLTEEVAQPTRMGTRSLFEVTHTSPLARMTWAFASEPRQKLALMAWAVRNARNDPARVGRVAMVVWLAGGLVAQVLRNLWRDAKDDDEFGSGKYWSIQYLAAASLGGPANGVPVLGSMIQDQIDSLFGVPSLPNGPLVTLGGAPSAAKRLVTLESFDEGGEWLNDLESVIRVAGMFNDTAAAVAAAGNIVTDAEKVMTKENKPKRKKPEKER